MYISVWLLEAVKFIFIEEQGMQPIINEERVSGVFLAPLLYTAI